MAVSINWGPFLLVSLQQDLTDCCFFQFGHRIFGNFHRHMSISLSVYLSTYLYKRTDRIWIRIGIYIFVRSAAAASMNSGSVELPLLRTTTLSSGLRRPHKHKDPTSEAVSFCDFRYDILSRRPLRFCRQQNFGRSSRGHGLELLIMTLSRTTQGSHQFFVLFHFVDQVRISPFFRRAESGPNTNFPHSVRSLRGHFFMCRVCFLCHCIQTRSSCIWVGCFAEVPCLTLETQTG